ncbi:hypothetical protein J4E85_006489 [Alternaria conjuncta]|uniref:uncharacterized protein n=1 Tax=Alternaria conjuncta TaxID=181017 RepID=UPI00221EE4E6|nr:uncharacterized protein J4E85_006489 [Alternaria conjuncta]KAI4926197.1 hypothetical protein J4E85_006489 [Alternaria conjuncta]
MAQNTVSRRDREDHFRFLDLPAELRNLIYDFAAETEADQPRCVLPCLALAQSCQQLRTEYRSICLKRDIVIDWKAVTGYMRTFFPTVNGKIENVELAPANMTIVTPWRGKEVDYDYELDILPLFKIGLYRPNFTCHLVHDPASLRIYGDQMKLQGRYKFGAWIDEDTIALKKVMRNRDPQWLSDINTGAITKVTVSNMGFIDPRATFYLTSQSLYSKLLDEELDELGETYFKRNGISSAWGHFPEFPQIRFEA